MLQFNVYAISVGYYSWNNSCPIHPVPNLRIKASSYKRTMIGNHYKNYLSWAIYAQTLHNKHLNSKS